MWHSFLNPCMNFGSGARQPASMDLSSHAVTQQLLKKTHHPAVSRCLSEWMALDPQTWVHGTRHLTLLRPRNQAVWEYQLAVLNIMYGFSPQIPILAVREVDGGLSRPAILIEEEKGGTDDGVHWQPHVTPKEIAEGILRTLDRIVSREFMYLVWGGDVRVYTSNKGEMCASLPGMHLCVPLPEPDAHRTTAVQYMYAAAVTWWLRKDVEVARKLLTKQIGRAHV